MKKALLIAAFALASASANAGVVAEKTWQLGEGRTATLQLTDQAADRKACTGPKSAKYAEIVSEGQLVAKGCWFSIENNQVAVFAEVVESGGVWNKAFAKRDFTAGPAFTGWSIARWE